MITFFKEHPEQMPENLIELQNQLILATQAFETLLEKNNIRIAPEFLKAIIEPCFEYCQFSTLVQDDQFTIDELNGALKSKETYDAMPEKIDDLKQSLIELNGQANTEIASVIEQMHEIFNNIYACWESLVLEKVHSLDNTQPSADTKTL